MAATFGIDFGTTNSLISVVSVDEGRAQIRRFLQQGTRPHPSVVWYPGEHPVAGQRAKDQLSELGLGVFGDIVRSPKMFLGQATGINIGGIIRSPIEVVADLLTFLRQDALNRRQVENAFENAVITIPVTMRGQARAELRQAAHLAGIRVHQFVHEPLAALYGYLRGKESFKQEIASLENRLVLVFDWGGGTLDLTLCQLKGGVLSQILNLGDREVGGDRFDDRLRQLVRNKHQAQFPEVDWTLIKQDADSRLIHACEDAKIFLSDRERTELFQPDIFDIPGDARHLEVSVTRVEFEEAVRDLVSRGLRRIEELLDQARVSRSAIEFCLATGGMIQVPAIRDGLREMFGMSRLRLIENATTVISEGAAWIAHDNLELQLAKPIEILHADNSYVTVTPEGTRLPTHGRTVSSSIDMYCVDPSDGVAKFLFTRPRWPDSSSQGDERSPYALLTLQVDRHSRPLRERLAVSVSIDENLIANVQANSLARGDSKRVSVYDLEFGIDVRPVLRRA